MLKSCTKKAIRHCICLNMNEKKLITLSNALGMLCNPHSTHAITYRKSSAGQVGKYGKKEGITIRTAKSDTISALSTSKKFGTDGIAKLYQPKTNKAFDVVIDLLIEIDGMIIEHPIK